MAAEAIKLQEAKVVSNPKGDKAKWLFQAFRWWQVGVVVYYSLPLSQVHIYLSSYAYKAALSVQRCCLTLTCPAVPSPTPHFLPPWTLGCAVRFHSVRCSLLSSRSHACPFLCSAALFPSRPPPSALDSYIACTLSPLPLWLDVHTSCYSLQRGPLLGALIACSAPLLLCHRISFSFGSPS